MSIRRIAIRSLAAASISMLAIVGPAAAVHAQPGSTQIAGLLVPDTAGTCHDDPASLGTYVVSGSLDGCWYTDTAVYKNQSHAGGFVATGTEHFVGCLGARCGQFSTTYTFTAKFTGDIEDHGRCHHPITGGEGDFAGVTGVINMHDLPNGCATYKGHLTP